MLHNMFNVGVLTLNFAALNLVFFYLASNHIEEFLWEGKKISCAPFEEDESPLKDLRHFKNKRTHRFWLRA